MNSQIPFDVNSDWTLEPYCQNNSNDPLVDKIIGNAYHVVRAVYCNLGNLKLLYDFLNSYGMVLGVKTEDELKKLNKLAKYARIYGFASTGDRQVTDYLYVPDDTTGIRPDDPTATGSWIKVATSDSGSNPGGGGEGSYIPYVYNKGSAKGGETSFIVPEGTIGVPFISINGSLQYVGYGFTYNPANATVSLGNPLVQGDEVIALTTAVPAIPDNPNVPGWVQVNWLYNNGSATGGEQVITVPYSFKDVPAVYKNGKRLYKNLQTESYIIDPVSRTVSMTEILAQGDRVIITLGGEAATIVIQDRTTQEVARANNITDSDVVLSSATNIVITNKKIIYDVVGQKYWKLPVLPPNSYIVKVENGNLTYNPGNETVALHEVDNPQIVIEALLSSIATENSVPMVGTFEDGATLVSASQSIGLRSEVKLFKWTGAFPKVVVRDSTPETTGGVGAGKWQPIGVTDVLRKELAGTDGAKLVYDGDKSVSDKLADLTRHALSGYSVIQNDVHRIASTANALDFNLSVVITGDSLSFNGVGYPGMFAVNYAGYATAQPFGLSSWSYLLRDAIFTATPAYKNIFDIPWLSDASVSGSSSGDLKNLGLNGKALKWTFAAGQSLSLYNDYPGTPALIVSKAPAESAVKFNIGSLEFNNTSVDGLYQSSEYMLIPLDNNYYEITIKNVRNAQTNAPGGSLTVYGITHAGRTWPRITGKGGWTSGQILSEFGTLVAPYSPDVIFYIIGANDVGLGVPVADFKSNVEAFVQQARALKSDSIIVLMSMPPEQYLPYQTIKPYIAAMKEIAIQYKCSLIDLYEAMRTLNPNYYRFDNIHWKAAGDNFVFNYVKDNIIPTLNSSTFNPTRETYTGAGGIAGRRASKTFNVSVNASETAPTKSNGGYIEPYITAYYTNSNGIVNLNVKAPVGFKISGFSYVPDTIGWGKRVILSAYNDVDYQEAIFSLIDNATNNPLSIGGTGAKVILTITRDESKI